MTAKVQIITMMRYFKNDRYAVNIVEINVSILSSHLISMILLLLTLLRIEWTKIFQIVLSKLEG